MSDRDTGITGVPDEDNKPNENYIKNELEDKMKMMMMMAQTMTKMKILTAIVYILHQIPITQVKKLINTSQQIWEYFQRREG